MIHRMAYWLCKQQKLKIRAVFRLFREIKTLTLLNVESTDFSHASTVEREREETEKG